jgi:regulator of sigma E protease
MVNMSESLIVQLVSFIIGIGVLIFVHELGHFLAARILKVEVEEFGFGFPPRMVKLFEAGGTLYTLNWIPLGGFVKPKGQDDPNVEGGLAAASPWVRLGVLFAGPIMNLLVGVILAVILIINSGVPYKVEITQVAAGSPAETAGLKTGDFILKVNDRDVTNSNEMYEEVYKNLGEPTVLVYQRGEQVSEVTLVPRNPPPPEGAIGIGMNTLVRPVGLLEAVPMGLNVAYEYAKSVLSLPGRIIQGEVSPAEGRPLGYKGMFDVYQQFQSPLPFFMIITLSLGIFNLLPIPALDGGRILFTLPEILIRRRIPQQYENMIHLVGFTMLLILLIYINIQDFINPVQLP